MMSCTLDYSLYLVTDKNCLGGRPLLRAVEQALAGGVSLVQYRAKQISGEEMFKEAVELRKLCASYDVPLIVNDRVDIALAAEAAGVHLGQGDLPCSVARKILGSDYIIGVSAHNSEEALQAVHDGADYIGCGAVFATNSKSDVRQVGLEGLAAVKAEVGIPVVGIGGITAANYADVLQTGADGAAVISGLLNCEDVYEAAQTFVKIFATLREVK